MSFEVRVFHLDSQRQESGTFDLDPALEDARRVVGVMREFLAGKPAQFKDAIPFLKHGAVELEWNAASGGVAFFAWSVDGSPAVFGAMVSDAASEAGLGVLGGFANTLNLADRPATSGETIWLAALPGRPEILPLLHLLTTSLGSAFFGALHRAAGES